MINLLFIICCTRLHNKQLTIGTVDIVDQDVCTLQLDTGELITLTSNFCKYLGEGDKIKIERHYENR